MQLINRTVRSEETGPVKVSGVLKAASSSPLPLSGLQGWFFQEVTETPSGRGSSMPSQHTPPSLVSATLVKMVFFMMVFMALGLVFTEVPGATPKKPFSGLMALRLPMGTVPAVKTSPCLCLKQGFY